MTKTHTRKTNAKIFYRVFPIRSIDEKLAQISKDRKTIYLRSRQELSRNPKNSTFWKFDSSGVFVNADQATIYNAVLENVLEQVFLGCDAVILGYGQTGSGKSVTISGVSALPQDIGIIPRLINNLFDEKKKLPRNSRMAIEMSYLEYGRYSAFDLLKEYPNQIPYPFVMTRVKIKNKYHAYENLFQGEGRKEFIFGTYLSHIYTSILTMFITIKKVDTENPEIRTSKIHIIDCAGVDSIGNKSCSMKTAVDVGAANVIKSDLEQLLMALCRNNEENVKLRYRLNPVLNHLRSSLNNDAVLRFIGHIRLDLKNSLITLSLLRFGQLINGLVMREKVPNPTMNQEMEISYLKNELNKIQKQRTLELILANQVPQISVDSERIEQMQNSLIDYLRGDKNMEDYLTVSDVTTTLKLFKDIYYSLEMEKQALYKEAYESAVDELSISVKEDKSQKSSDKLTSITSMNSSKNKSQSVTRSSKPSESKTRYSSEQSSGKKKSITSVGSKGEPKKLPSFMIPEKVLEFQEAWQKYTSDKSNQYLVFLEEYKNNEAKMHEAYLAYMDQITLSKDMKKIIQIREKEYFELQVLLKLDEADPTDDSVDQQLQLCMSNLKCARSNYLAQQEKLLTCKANFLIHLELRENLKNALAEDFDKFCTEIYNALTENNIDSVLVDFQTDLGTIKEEEKTEVFDECEEIVRKKDAFTEEMRKFKTLMDKEIEKKKRYKKKHKSLIKH